MTETIAGIDIPDTELAREATELVRKAETPLLFNHSRRVFLFASLKGRYRAFDPAMLTGAVERLTLGRDLKLAVERDEIELHYQPVVDLVTGRARGVEALARWTHAQRGPVPKPSLCGSSSSCFQISFPVPASKINVSAPQRTSTQGVLPP